MYVYIYVEILILQHYRARRSKLFVYVTCHAVLSNAANGRAAVVAAAAAVAPHPQCITAAMFVLCS